jgi:hypothetical protein
MSYQLQEISCLVAHQIYKGCSSWIKRPAQVTVQQMQKKDLNMKRRKDLNGFSTQNGAKVILG